MPRRTLPATATFAAVAAVLLTACGGTDSASDTSSSDDSKAPAAAAARPLSAADLDAKVLASADVKGFLVSEVTKEEKVTADKVTSDRDDCEPLSRSLSGVALDDPSATAQRRATGKKKAPSGDVAKDDVDAAVDAAFDTTTSVVTLASYADEAAATKALTSIGKSVTACAAGYTYTAMGTEQKITKVTADTAPKAGDAAIAFTAAVQQEGMPKPGPMKVAAFRTGTTVTYVSSVNPASLMKGGDFEFPTVLVETQAKKLG
ncbi:MULTISPECIES: hypothetical protein [unclassified Streptomyces]|uniref:hypothetical protein n=1 Tax=unclassified Streptomyces TaxID=2593676 RepID=UPI000689D830|nr:MULTISPECIES: hypothetical protein [unclassified Streptomyces]